MDDEGFRPFDIDQKVLAPAPERFDCPAREALETPPVERLAKGQELPEDV
jgi:hypothetical protein